MAMQIFFYRFQPRLIPGLAVLAMLALFIHLGLWQDGKAGQVEAQRALYKARSEHPPIQIGTDRVVPETLVYAQGAVRGEYEAEKQFYVDNQVEGGRPGVHVITPLRIDGGDTRILVNRGWLAWEDRRAPPRFKSPDGTVELTGIIVAPGKQKYLLMPERQEAWPELWSSLDIERYAKATAHPVQPVILQLTSAGSDDGLLRNWPQPEDKVSMHKGYALQWFGMAMALVGFYFVASFRKMKR
jgi:surfeit locus 1 family protein